MEKIIGKINLTTGKVTVTDPCYDKREWCTASLDNVYKGEWEAVVTMQDCGNWGNRVAYLEIKAVGETEVKNERVVACIGVDAGVCGIFEDKPNYDDSAWHTICSRELHNKNYGLAQKENAFKCVGAWSSSGYGDGEYDVYAGYNKDGEIVSLTLDYGVDVDTSEYEEDMFEFEEE